MSLPRQYVAIDTETTGLNPWRGARMFAAAAAFPSGRNIFWRDEFNSLKQLCEDPETDKIFCNARFDIRMLRFAGIGVRGAIWDVSILAHLLDGRQAGHGLSLERMTQRYLPPTMRKVTTPVAEVFAKLGLGKKQYDFRLLPHDLLEQRCTSDAVLTLHLFQRLYPTVATLFPYLLHLEHRLIPTVIRMEDRGLEIDTDEIERQVAYLETVIEEVCDFCECFIGTDYFNINGRKDVLRLLELAGLIEACTDPQTKKISADDAHLAATRHPAAYMLLLGRSAYKMMNTFLAQLQTLSVDGVIHPSFNALGTCTGRFSCARPNLQNLPSEGDVRARRSQEDLDDSLELTGYNYSQHIKRCIRVRKGFVHIHGDKQQAELRALAHYSEDAVMLQAFRRNLSIHDEMCRLMFGEINKTLKTWEKMVVFGFIYGSGVDTTAKLLRVPAPQAAAYRHRLAQVVPGLMKWQRRLRDQLQDRGYVQTIHGRRHYLRESESYMVVNRMCQGTVGDEVKGRMAALDDYFQSSGCGTLLINVHDDLGSEIPIERQQEMIPEIRRIMNTTDHSYIVPMPSDLSITTDHWGNLHALPAPTSH